MACDRVWGLRQGARYYLTKPVEKTELMACVESVLNYASWFSPHAEQPAPAEGEVLAWGIEPPDY